MPVVRNATVIKEEGVGEDKNLCFPGMSTCTAVVMVAGATLLGAHFTADRAKDVDSLKPHTKKLVQRLKDKLGARIPDRLLIVGFNVNHNPALLAQALGFGSKGDYARASLEAFDISNLVSNYREDIMITFEHSGDGAQPSVDYKRTSKTVREETADNPKATKDNLFDGRKSVVTINNTPHYLRQHFTNLAALVG
ncbi:hypothetical protein V8J88_05635 [Massilia sp. W12]|uniref:hypothetical protein n=1 Tax=Massilia sp. W12 TaxID=3126507 RepID=UPI0030D3273F